jgi:hypothetical protein
LTCHALFASLFREIDFSAYHTVEWEQAWHHRASAYVHFSNQPIEVKRFQTYDLDAGRSAESLERRRRLMQAKAADDKADISNALGRCPLSGI